MRRKRGFLQIRFDCNERRDLVGPPKPPNPSTNTNKLEDFRNKSQQTNRSLNDTGKSVSEALILELVNPHYDYRLFIELRVQNEKNTSCVQKLVFLLFLFWHSKHFLYTTCSELCVKFNEQSVVILWVN